MRFLIYLSQNNATIRKSPHYATLSLIIPTILRKQQQRLFKFVFPFKLSLASADFSCLHLCDLCIQQLLSLLHTEAGLSGEARGPVNYVTNQQARRPSPLEAPEDSFLRGPLRSPVGVRSRGRPEVPERETPAQMQRAEPVDFTLISEMNSTIHIWPWPETEITMNV